ncbi:hypothetical protein HETIRDRAFT_101903, partial [Heterobasidion irregulare TC 32-1]
CAHTAEAARPGPLERLTGVFSAQPPSAPPRPPSCRRPSPSSAEWRPSWLPSVLTSSCIPTGRVHRGPACPGGGGRGTLRPPASLPLLSRPHCTAYPRPATQPPSPHSIKPRRLSTSLPSISSRKCNLASSLALVACGNSNLLRWTSRPARLHGLS